MAQIINTNLISLNAQRNLAGSHDMLARSVQRLSTGQRINSARDDAAGLAIAERMNTRIRGANAAIRNASDGISLLQTAEGAMARISDMGQRMRELAVQSANATNSDTDRAALNEEYQALGTEIKRLIEGTEFNGIRVLGQGIALDFQVGADAGDQIEVILQGQLGRTHFSHVVGNNTATPPPPISSADGARDALGKLDRMLNESNSVRAEFGVLQNRFEAIIQTLQIEAENHAAARSRIMDADFARESAALTRAQVLQQAGTAMLTQANALPNNVLSLLR
ncbi:MAG: flagellin [Lautropia sp.]|nr:flagellin [Lautropia sp.]